MNVHIVDPYSSAAMTRMTAPLLEYLAPLHNVTKSEEVDMDADVNIHIPFHSLVGLEDKGKGRHIVAYTHCNIGNEPHVIDACQRADMVTAMSYEGRRELIAMGVDPKKIWVIYCGADDFSYRKRLIGVIGYPQPNGRKREGILLDLAWQYDMMPFQFILTGQGWEGMSERLNALGVSCSWHHADTFEKLEQTMRLLDVLLVTGYREGGPLPLLECMASGVPVLSPDFGYASDLLSEDEKYSTVEELHGKLMGLFDRGMLNHQLAKMWSWKDYAAEYALLIGQLTGSSVDIFPERGMSRYKQLYDIIDDIKPASICEIGTWNGKNALRMLQTAARHHDMNDLYYMGFDLFDKMTAEDFYRENSKKSVELRVVQRMITAAGIQPDLVVGNTNETINEITDCDFYFVDGGHSEKTIQNDGEAVLSVLRYGQVAVFDDYYHGDKPDGIGANKFVDSLDQSLFEITHLPHLTEDPRGHKIGMVKVTRKNADIRVSVQKQAYTTTYTLN